MFSAEEILEEFADAALLGREAPLDYTFGATLRGIDPEDPASVFINASDEEREVLRKTPVHYKHFQEDKSEAPTQNARRTGSVELTLADAEAIRRSKGVSHRELARRYGVSFRTIGRILRGETYRPETGREFKIHTWEHSGIYERWKNGEAINAIARSKSVRRSTIKRILTKYTTVCTDARKRPEERSREIAVFTDSHREPGPDCASVDAREREVR